MLGDRDELIIDRLEESGLRILNDIGQSSMPDGLIPTWVSITVDLLRIHHGGDEVLFGDTAVKPGDIKSISEGGTSISFGVSAGAADLSGGGTPKSVLDGIVANYEKDLCAYRRLSWGIGRLANDEIGL